MVVGADSSKNNGSPPTGYPNNPPQPPKPAASNSGSMNKNSGPPPPPQQHPPPPHSRSHYYAYPPPPPPPPSQHYEMDRGPNPGPYTTAQYDARKATMPIPPPHPHGHPHPHPHHAYHAAPRPRSASGGSPPTMVVGGGGRDPPPPYHHRVPVAEPPLPRSHASHAPPPHARAPGAYASYPTSSRGGEEPQPPHTRPAPRWRTHAHTAPPPPEAAAFSSGRYYESSYPPVSNAPPPPPSQAYAPPPPPPPPSSQKSLQQQQQQHDQHDPHGVGPYRFSDPTLRREAITRGLSDRNRSIIVEVDGREGATSPSQIETHHREEVTTMGCTCKKTKCLKLYCQCFAVKIYCGGNCRCMVCRNTTKFEGERKDAIRSILSRNPSAFDTKFKKFPAAASQQVNSKRALSHKLGCKCRKSACMKKYCECYAGSVKCSANCRCAGCKNMPRGGLGGASGASSAPVLRNTGSISSTEEDISSGRNKNVKKQEPWMMNAAHNLAFLKHASPVAQKMPQRRTHSADTDVGSMPSLASEELSPTEHKTDNHNNIDKKTVSVTGASAIRRITEPTSSEKTAVNALLMAAMAMTKMSTKDEPTSVSTPPTSKPSQEDDRQYQPMDTYETPPKNLLAKFKSPKRKQSEAAANPQDIMSDAGLAAAGSMRRNNRQEEEDCSSPSANNSDDDSPKRDHPGDATPSNQQQKVKRSRIGSLKKGSRNLDAALLAGNTNTATSTSANKAAAFETPKTKGEGGKLITELTPVSARCIDFRKMHVNESNHHNPAETIDSTG